MSEPDEQKAPELTEAELQDYEVYANRCKMLPLPWALRLIAEVRRLRNPWNSRSLLELAEAQGVNPLENISALQIPGLEAADFDD